MEKAGMKNKYVCQECSESIVTLNVDDGVTPFMILCLATKGCGGVMYSSFYSVDQDLPAQFEWYKPKSLKGLSKETKNHVRKGGLLLRKCGVEVVP